MSDAGAGPRTDPTMGGRLAGMTELHLTVDEVADLTPKLRAIWLAGAPDDFAYEAGQDLMLSVPDGADPIRRRYTIRRIDERGRIEVWFVLHGHGPAGRWAAAAAPGSTIDAIGPRGKVTARADVSWHLFAGDESGAAAVLHMAEAVAPGVPSFVLLEVEGADDELATGVPVQWLHRDGRAPGDNDLLERAIAALDLPDGDGHVYLAAEKATVRRIRGQLEARGIDRDHQSPKAYWDRSRANGGHGEPMPDGRPGDTAGGG